MHNVRAFSCNFDGIFPKTQKILIIDPSKSNDGINSTKTIFVGAKCDQNVQT
jgi:hypothetical protein